MVIQDKYYVPNSRSFVPNLNWIKFLSRDLLTIMETNPEASKYTMRRGSEAWSTAQDSR
jgi:hypothetical protein